MNANKKQTEKDRIHAALFPPNSQCDFLRVGLMARGVQCAYVPL